MYIKSSGRLMDWWKWLTIHIVQEITFTLFKNLKKILAKNKNCTHLSGEIVDPLYMNLDFTITVSTIKKEKKNVYINV